MFRLGKAVALVSILVVAPASASTTLGGTWRRVPAAPSAVFPGTSVWTGKQLIVFGRRPGTSVDVAEAYDLAAKRWTRLTPPPGPQYEPAAKAVWTGKEMLAWGAFHSVAFDPRTNAWRPLRRSIQGGIIVWTGREAIGWGGGCCGDAFSNGAAYRPSTDTFRDLARSPLAPSQRPIGAWTGRELVLLVSGVDPDGKPYPARLARAAAYNPATDTWRRLARQPIPGGAAVWDGRELLVAGAGARARSALAYNPATNRWRRLRPLPSGRFGASVVWTGRRLLLWGGGRDGLAYDPRADRWSTLPRAPLRARESSTVAWTGRALIVWGGVIGTPAGTRRAPRYPADGAAFTPARG